MLDWFVQLCLTSNQYEFYAPDAIMYPPSPLRIVLFWGRAKVTRHSSDSSRLYSTSSFLAVLFPSFLFTVRSVKLINMASSSKRKSNLNSDSSASDSDLSDSEFQNLAKKRKKSPPQVSCTVPTCLFTGRVAGTPKLGNTGTCGKPVSTTSSSVYWILPSSDYWESAFRLAHTLGFESHTSPHLFLAAIPGAFHFCLWRTVSD